MTNREIAAHLQELFGAEVSASLISAITDTVADEVRAWQTRPLDALYPIMYLDCLMVKSRNHGSVGNRSIYLAMGINTDGMKEMLGLWSAPTEGAKFWLSVVAELKNRGVKDILIACVDSLKGFPEAIAAVFPHTEIQRCIVHLVRNSLNYVSWKQRKATGATAIILSGHVHLLLRTQPRAGRFPSAHPKRRARWFRHLLCEAAALRCTSSRGRVNPRMVK